jgi:hypothetical protein
MKFSRRNLFMAAGAGAVAQSVVSPASAESPAPRAQRAAGYRPVRTLNGWTLPYTLKGGVKEFHLVAEEFEH